MPCEGVALALFAVVSFDVIGGRRVQWKIIVGIIVVIERAVIGGIIFAFAGLDLIFPDG